MSSLNALRLFVDVLNRRLVSSPYDPSSPTLPTFVKDDIFDIEVYPLISNTFAGLGENPFNPVTSTTLYTDAKINIGPLTTGSSTNYLAANTSLTAQQKLFSAEVLSGGSNYNIGDILKITNGTQVEAAKVEVTAVESGAVTAVKIYDEGAHTSGIAHPGNGWDTTIFCTANTNAANCTLLAKFAQTFVGSLSLQDDSLETALLDGATLAGTTKLEIVLKNNGTVQAGTLRSTTVLQTDINITEDVMSGE